MCGYLEQSAAEILQDAKLFYLYEKESSHANVVQSSHASVVQSSHSLSLSP